MKPTLRHFAETLRPGPVRSTTHEIHGLWPLYGSGLSAPEDGAMLKVAYTTMSSLRKLIAGGIAETAPFPTKAGPFVAYRPMNLMRTCSRSPVNGAALKMVEATYPVGSSALISEWVSQE
jgi:hypothetical protein